MYCYADDIGLLSPTLSGLKEMMKLCEDYTLKHKIIFNASKSQLLYFPSNTARVPKDFMLKMKSGQVIPYTDTCNYLEQGEAHFQSESTVREVRTPSTTPISCLHRFQESI